MDLITFHLYHHMPDPLQREQLSDQRWLCNNALAYSLVAVIRAQNQGDALVAARRKATGEGTAPRSSEIQADALLRDTLPGDVLVSSQKAWMVQANGTLHELSYASSLPRRWLKQDRAVSDLAWSPDGQILLAAEEQKRIVVHDLTQEDEKYPRGYARDEYATACVVWSPKGERVASAGYYGEVHLWTPCPWRSERHIGSFLVCCTDEPRESNHTITSLTWSPDGSSVFAGRRDGQIAQWNAQTGLSCVRVQLHAKDVTALAFDPGQEHHVLSADVTGLIQIWDVQSTQVLVPYQHARAVTAAVWSPDGSVVASAEQDDAALHLWNPQTGRLLERLPLSISTTHPPTALSLAWSPDGQWLGAGCDDGTVQLFSTTTSQHMLTYRAGLDGTGEIHALAWSPDGQWLASAGEGRYNSTLATKIWAARQDLEAL